jgi:hypothetical protein
MEHLPIVWSEADWVFNSEIPNLYDGMLDNLDAWLCKAVATGISNVQNNEVLLGNFCKHNIVSTGSLVLEKPLSLSPRMYGIC